MEVGGIFIAQTQATCLLCARFWEPRREPRQQNPVLTELTVS